MSLCDTCIFGTAYPKPEKPAKGFASDIVETLPDTWWNRFWRGGDLNVKRQEVFFDEEKFIYEIDLEYHTQKVYCEAMPKAGPVNKHSKCSMYKER